MAYGVEANARRWNGRALHPQGSLDQADQQIDRRLLVSRVLLGEPVEIGQERTRLGRRRGIRRLGHDAFDPGPELSFRAVGLGHLVAEVARQATAPVIEQGQQQLVLRAEMPVERLGRDPRLAQDVAHGRVEAAGAFDDLVGGGDDALDLVGIGGLPSGQRPGDGPVDQRAADLRQLSAGGDGHRKVGGCRTLFSDLRLVTLDGPTGASVITGGGCGVTERWGAAPDAG